MKAAPTPGNYGRRSRNRAIPAATPASATTSAGISAASPSRSATATTDLPSLRHFAQHLERDLDAVIAGLTLPWNSGVVEGHVNRIKMLKRQMFGRAGFELLRKRVLLACTGR